MCERSGLCCTDGQLKYRELKPFGELLVRCTKVTGALETVDNGGMIPTPERVSNIRKVRIQQFT